jgi:hypothetical protein
MNEKFTPRANHGHEAPKPNKEAIQLQHERVRQAHEKAAREAEHAERQKPSVEALQKKAEINAKSKHDHLVKTQSEKTNSDIPVYSNSSLRKHASKRMQKQIQRQLKTPDRMFSKVIHQPAVEAVSNATEGTIGRPSGLLMGGLFSLIASSTVLYICRHYGYEYNFLIGSASFIGGFALGILLEGFHWLVLGRTKQQS